MMQQADRQRLTHIYEYCVSIENAIGRFGNGFEAFDSDEDFRTPCPSAFCRSASWVAACPRSTAGRRPAGCSGDP